MANGLDDSIQKPTPDPTVLTTEQLLRTAQAERDYVDGRIDVITERLSGMDRATELLSETVNRVPTETQKEIEHLGSLVTERFDSIKIQFKERDTRSERESRDNKVAVDAAFAAQKESAAKQDESNAKAINKSELATTETINKLAELFKTTTDALSDKIDDLKDRVQSIESKKQGIVETVQQGQAVTTLQLIGVSAFLTFVLIVTGLIIKFA
jgi:cation transport regulator ChaB